MLIGTRFDLETRAREVAPNIGRYKKFRKHEMLDTETGAIIKCKPRETKNEKFLTKVFKKVFRVVTSTFFGTSAERLIKFFYDEAPENTYTDWKYCLQKLQRRAKQKLVYILVLQYTDAGLPVLEVWLKTANDEKINLTQEIVQECWDFGKVEIIRLTPTNLDELASYYIQKSHTRYDKYPSYSKLYRTSKTGINKVDVELLDYEEAEKRVAGLERTFEVTKALVDVVDNKEICFQEITYETYIKPKADVEQAVDDT